MTDGFPGEGMQDVVDDLRAAGLNAIVLDENTSDAQWDQLGQMFSASKKESDVDPHQPGAKLDAGKVRMSLVMHGFADALLQVGKVGTFGANKYTENGWMKVPNGIGRYTDAMYRHLMAEGGGEVFDSESELHHAAHTAWNALARLQLMLDNRKEDR